ncbi:FAD-dependent oxidoreductase [Flexibacterium corallicola]|uniref:FAD-dependent oxidoreductase n=1 Tax=Flexibacterium corallicola TaxID=3037259 RepID=UPI00286F7F12|nr:FAD-dependent oxidoreductase [Pseudovibrio sp. M1P-2-3]
MITIAGAGLAGLACAFELAKKGGAVTIYERGVAPGEKSVARFAGGMLAPYCELESAEKEVVTLGRQAADWWSQITSVTQRGTLVVAPSRDQAELTRFSRRTSHFEYVDGQVISKLEPALEGRFNRGLFFKEEAHLDPRQALIDLSAAVQKLGVEIVYGTNAPAKTDMDCTATAANLPNLRSVRGEMAILHCPELDLSRVVRLLHPRMPLYLVPRADGLFMIGGTMIESDSKRPPTLRSLTEMMSAAFTIHPAFAEASVVEIGAGLRPAFPDNLPRLVEHMGTLHLNGLYRHGFLLAPAMAQKASKHFLVESH